MQAVEVDVSGFLAPNGGALANFFERDGVSVGRGEVNLDFIEFRAAFDVED
jgi:hypothetical protein